MGFTVRFIRFSGVSTLLAILCSASFPAWGQVQVPGAFVQGSLKEPRQAPPGVGLRTPPPTYWLDVLSAEDRLAFQSRNTTAVGRNRSQFKLT
jgi:hypothetical protein